MAATLVYDCPHCATANAGFTFIEQANTPDDPEVWIALFRCNTCFFPLAIRASFSHGSPKDRVGNLFKASGLIDIRCFPKARPLCAPEHVPAEIARAFIEAETNIRQKNFNAAAAMDRRALELVTHEQSPEKGKATLYQRIDHLVKTGELTPALGDWAHQLRSLGNGAVHDPEGIGQSEAVQAHDLTRLILIYLYTLPRQIELSRANQELTH